MHPNAPETPKGAGQEANSAPQFGYELQYLSPILQLSEYIYYTVDEYEIRKMNPGQKGEARSRIKTFKVDDANIPFTLPDGRWFLYTVLERHFQNTELIQEYFQKVL